MDNLADILKLPKQQKKKLPKYRFQELCLEIAEMSGAEKGVVFELWNRHGYSVIEPLHSQLKKGEIKNAKAYVYWLLKNHDEEKTI